MNHNTNRSARRKWRRALSQTAKTASPSSIRTTVPVRRKATQSFKEAFYSFDWSRPWAIAHVDHVKLEVPTVAAPVVPTQLYLPFMEVAS